MPEPPNAIAAPAFSVVIPLYDWRDSPLDCIRSWTHKQSLARDRFEVLVVGNGTNPTLEQQVAAMLPPQDRLLHAGVPNEIELYNEGAKAARGGMLVFTENHCMAAGDCLERLAAWFDAHPGMDGACLNSVTAKINTFARMEDLVFEARFSDWKTPEHWHKALLRGFAVRRAVFDDVGGFDARHHLFADVLMSAKLREGGRNIGFADKASVVHLNTTAFPELFEHVSEYAAGECLFRAEHDAAYCEKYFGHSEVWSRRLALRPDVAAELYAALVEARRAAGFRRALRLWRTSLAFWPARTFGPRAHRWMAWLSVAKARVRYEFWRFDEGRRLAAFRDWWSNAGQYVRTGTILKNLAKPLPPAGLVDLQDGTASIPMPAFPEPQLVCFHGLETHQGKTFRWSAPVAQMLLRLPAGHYEVALDTGGIRGNPGAYLLGLSWNGRPVERSRCKIGDDSVAFEVPAVEAHAGDQRLTLVAEPLDARRSPEARSLGMPVRGISFRALSGAPAPAERQQPTAATA